MKKYIRFGEIPKNEQSVNFLKMTLDEVEAFSWALDALGADVAYSEYIPEKAFENGVSAFEIDEQRKPVFKNINLIISFCRRLKEKSYIISGDPVGFGRDGDVLLKNVKKIEPYYPNEEYIIQIMQNHFKNCVFDENFAKNASSEMNYFVDFKTGKKEYTFKGWTFSDPVDDF